MHELTQTLKWASRTRLHADRVIEMINVRRRIGSMLISVIRWQQRLYGADAVCDQSGRGLCSVFVGRNINIRNVHAAVIAKQAEMFFRISLLTFIQTLQRGYCEPIIIIMIIVIIIRFFVQC